jgi:GNAT superfamily N-acetyltransferase
LATDVRPFDPNDAPRLAEIVQRCLREVNSRDYPAEIIDKMCAHFTAERFIELSGSRRIYVAEDDRVVGTVSRAGNKVYTMFVDPDLTDRGIGRQLMQHIEALAARDGYDHMEAGASTSSTSSWATPMSARAKPSSASTTSSANLCHQPTRHVIHKKGHSSRGARPERSSFSSEKPASTAPPSTAPAPTSGCASSSSNEGYS